MKNLEQAMRKFNVTFYDIQDVMGCTEKTVRNKMNGVTDFSYSEVKRIRDSLFPGMDIEYLFSDDAPTTTSKT